MKFNIWTFAFQIINFAVLLFVLKRVLYKPVREIMEKRRELIARTIGDAEKKKSEAEELRRKNQEEMESIKEMRTRMAESMRAEITEEKKRLLAGAEAEAGKIIERKKALFEMDISKAKAELRGRAIETVTLYASQLFSDISDEMLHNAIFRKAREDIGRIAAEIRDRKAADAVVTVEIISAYPPEKEVLEELVHGLESETGVRVELHAESDRGLIAGIKLKAYDMVYDMSLAGQIRSLSKKLGEKV